MTPITYDTAVLIFSRFAEEEAKEKGYQQAVGKKGGLHLAEGLIDYTVREARLSGLPVFSCFSDKQTGKTFGERLANSIDEVYNTGVENIIVIGTDCSSLTADTIITAAANLKENAVVLGPSPDGGIYLIGMHRSAYCRNTFMRISWLTSHVFQHLKRTFTSAGDIVHTLSSHIDIDHWSGLLHWQQIHTSHYLSQLVAHIMAGFNATTFFSYASSFITRYSISGECLRGPPSLTSAFR